ncbi:ABC transporter ATP-binding protein [Frigoriflavimonas asaccharolytica]|uniref:Iron complex transport system ATP-binding protein n=1 Tax=Frigoriflavimonas asaccharolytica TaxID=2735899 RepID=A0A8J8GBX1_9FLAO|nr:ABC transporter ATP-binding protein [Frigoriflavimonas asaccharolytica]NRS93130.1 iron complex transport system ATP-binding protein [Frigoriflavimonas asaccharolytica]
MKNYLHISNAEFGYEKTLISEVNSNLKLGEICLLIGSNGVGKTTLIKSLLGQIPLLKGEIFIKDKNIKDLSKEDLAKQISVVFSKGEIPPQYTVYDLIAFGKYIHYPYYFKLNNDDKKEIDQIIENLHLSEFKNTYLHQLSDGNLQKAFIGRALAQNSPIIFLDEPTTHLDEENKIMILKLLRNLAENKDKIIFFSSHDWRIAKEFADKIWYVKDKILQHGISEDIILSNAELAAPQIFNIHKNFVPPKISAPDLQKELLYSFLQKNYQKNLSHIHFSFLNNNWNISSNNQEIIAKKFEDIIDILTNL